VSDFLKKVQAGDKLEIPASAYNAFVDAALAYKNSQINIGAGSQNKMFLQGRNLVKVKNVSGSAVDRFSVLGISNYIFSPATDLQMFQSEAALEGTTPAASHRGGGFVICAEPILSNGIGLAWAAGVCITKINVAAETHKYADVAAGQTGYLNSADGGPCFILKKESGKGTKWGIVRFGASCAGRIRRAVATANAGSGSTITCNLYNDDTGEAQSSGDEAGITVYCTICGGSNLNEAVPRLAAGSDLFVTYLPYYSGGSTSYRWYCTTVFNASMDCS